MIGSEQCPFIATSRRKVPKNPEIKKNQLHSRPYFGFFFLEKSDLQLFVRKVTSKYGSKWILIKFAVAIIMVLLS